MSQSREPTPPRAVAPPLLMQGMSQTRLLAAVALLGAAALSVWALLPAMFVEERGEPAGASAVTEPSASISEKDELPASGPEGPASEAESMPTTTIDTFERHQSFARAVSAFDPDAEVPVPKTVNVQNKGPVVIFDMLLSSDLTEYLPDISIRAADVDAIRNIARV